LEEEMIPQQNQKPSYEKESLEFLANDFSQSFQQMRHYDSQIADLLKFIFTAYTALIGLAIGLYKYGLKESIDFSSAAIASLFVGLVIGLFIFGVIIRNRDYFVRVARYVNEQREFYFKYKPVAFQNKSAMFTDCSLPAYWNWRSSQSWLGYISAALNATVLAVIIYIICPGEWGTLTILGSGLFIIQIILAIIYLVTRENKSSL
jgi:hypothetical protein